MNLPNKLTCLRMILIIPFVIFMLAGAGEGVYKWIALAIFIIASLTDMLDGQIARKYNLITDFGKFMDPLADKMVVCAVLICFIEMGLLPAWLVIIVVAREFAISGFRAVAADKNKVIAANKWGKIKSQFQYNAIITVLVILVSGYTLTWEGFYFDVYGDIALFKWFFLIYSNAVIWLMVAFTVISLYTYLHDNWSIVSEDM